MRSKVTLLCAVLSACSFRIAPLSMEVDLGWSAEDLAATLATDLSRQPAAADLSRPTDLSGPCGGRAGGRRCAGAVSGRCDATAAFVPERPCTGDGCEDGHCRRPAPSVACRRDGDCAAGATCQPFTTVFNSYGLHCAPPPGPSGELAPCREHGECRWNSCQLVAGVTRCLRPCLGDEDCAGGGRCGPQEPITEGFRTSSTFCGP